MLVRGTAKPYFADRKVLIFLSKLKRSDKLAFLGIVSGGETVFHRLTGFTEFSVSKNGVNYSRQYVDEDFERNDIVSYAPSISYSFDFDNENAAHKKIVEITDGEMIGDDAVISLLIVDKTAAEKNATLRSWTVIPDKEGSDKDAYDYSGTFRANGEKVFGNASSEDNWQSCAFLAL